MNARNDVNGLLEQGAGARFALAERLAARLDRLVARWLERRAADAEAAQWLFRIRRDREVRT